MKFYAQINTPLGPMLLSSQGTQLDGLYFVGQDDCPAVGGHAFAKPGKADPTAGMMASMAIKELKAHKKRITTALFDDDDSRPHRRAHRSDTGGIETHRRG